MKIYVGNLLFTATEEQLKALFEQYGTVTSVRIESDRETGRPRGFGFVEMATGGVDAIANLHGYELDKRSLTVNEARPTDNIDRRRRW